MIPHPGARLTIMALLFFFHTLYSFGQKDFNTFHTLTTEHGLSDNIIYSIHQDRNGYLWIGANEGLNLYDGYSFTLFKHDPVDTNSISSNRVLKIFEDSTGGLWPLTLQGLCRYNSTDRNLSLKYILQDPNQFLYLLNDHQSLIHSDNQIQQWDLVSKKKMPVRERSKSTPPTIRYALKCAKDASGRIIVAGIDKESLQLWHYDVDLNELVLFRRIKLIRKYHGQMLYAFFIDSSGRFWINVMNDILKFDNPLSNENGAPEVIWSGHKQAGVMHFYEDRRAHLWICTTSGLLAIDKYLEPTNLFTNTTAPNALNSNNTNCIFQDNTGVMWIGTYNGLNKLNPSALLFRHLVHTEKSDQSIQSNAVFGIYQQNENQVRINYLFGAPTFSTLDLRAGHYTHYNLDTADVLFNLSHIFLKNPMQLDASGILLLQKQMDQEMFRQSKLPGTIYLDDQRHLWYNYGNTLLLVNTMERWELQTTMYDLVTNGEELYIVTDSGLMIFNRKTRQFLPGENGHFIGGKYGSFVCLLSEENGDLWLGTKGRGLLYFNRKESTFQQFGTDKGLCHESIYSMVKDKNGRLWLGTANGLSCFDPASKSFMNYFPADGVINTEYNRYSALELPDGTIYMGGMNGIDVFHPDHLPFERSAPLVSITGFKVHNQSLTISEDVLSLQHDSNNINIAFAVMDYQHVPLNKFKYMLEGADREWTISKNPQTSYASLAPGQYQFIVYGANSNGTWSKSPARIAFSIRVPWWNSWWFYTASVLLAFSFLYALYRYRLRHLEKIYSIRNEISRDLHDQVGATLTSISFLSEVAKQQSTEDDMAKETLTKIGDYSREMIGEMNDIVWSINPGNDKFDNIGERMQNYASPLLAAKNIKFDFSSDLHLKNITLTPQQRKNLYLIFKEAVNNAAKYSQGNHITVSLERRSGNLMMKVTDDGKGFVPENGEIGNGLINMKMRAAAVKGQLSILSSKDSGTKIVLEMPITQNAYVV